MEALLLQMLLGAAMGATTSAITGDDPGQGALRGAGSAGIGHALGGRGYGSMGDGISMINQSRARGSVPSGNDFDFIDILDNQTRNEIMGSPIGSGSGGDWERALRLFQSIGGGQQAAHAPNLPKVINPRPLFLPKVGPESYWK